MILMQDNRLRRQRNGSVFTGIVFITGGLLLLAYKMGAGIPSWIFSWPIILIIIGLKIAVQSKFRNPGGYILLVVGSLFLLDKQLPELNMGNYIAPIAFISFGLMFIFRPKHHNREDWRTRWKKDWEYTPAPIYDATSTEGDFLDATSVFGGAKKVIVSKNFKGGDITCFMGGAEIDLGKADIQGRVVLDLTNIFGGTKLNIPSHWDVKNEITAVFGGVEDKRSAYALNIDPTKTIVLTGTAIFGGVEINSYS